MVTEQATFAVGGPGLGTEASNDVPRPKGRRRRCRATKTSGLAEGPTVIPGAEGAGQGHETGRAAKGPPVIPGGEGAGQGHEDLDGYRQDRGTALP